MKRFATYLLTMVLALGISACEKKDEASSLESSNYSAEETLRAVVQKSEENLLVIKVLEAVEEESLLAVMSYLQAKGGLAYTMSGTMVSGINGKNNPADYSSCWMLYTSDSEFSNEAWGTITIDGQEFGSAVLGAELLPVRKDALYVWSFQTF